jgi:hypothetical protein
MLKSREYYLSQAAYMINKAMQIAGTDSILIRVMSSTCNVTISRWDFLDSESQRNLIDSASTGEGVNGVDNVIP